MEEVELQPGIELFSSMRSVGYSFEVAVADIVDNSITAGATIVDIDVDIHKGRYVTIADNGHGMDRETLIDGMAFARRARNRGSSDSDLGRFGMGMKTASLSQAAVLSVFSKCDQKMVGFCWDSEYVSETGRWVVKEVELSSIDDCPGVRAFGQFDSGTLVYWSDLDMLLRDAKNVTEFLSEKVSILRYHLGLVFHRFIAGENVHRVVLSVNGKRVQAIDPFLRDYPKTQIGQEVRLVTGGASCRVQPYTLPFISDISAEDNRRGDLGDVMRENQGFYVFRNSRLISWGGWFGLRARDEANKQARVSIDLHSSMDKSWQVDMKKQRSEPPQEFRELMRGMLEGLTERSRRSHTFRGRVEGGSQIAHVWNRVSDRDSIRYRINREHPAVQSLVAGGSFSSSRSIDSFLKLVEESLPLYDISTAYEGGSRLPRSENYLEEAKAKLRNAIEVGLVAPEMDSLPVSILSIEPFIGLQNPQDVWKSVRSEYEK